MPSGVYVRTEKHIEWARRLALLWKGKKHTEKTKRKMSEANSGEKNYWYGKKLSEEHRKKMGASKKGKKNPNWGLRDDKSINWQGGSSNYWHKQSKRLFGNGKCEICGMKENEHFDKFGIKLHMHCVTGDYRIMRKSNWKTLCIKHHKEVHIKQINGKLAVG